MKCIQYLNVNILKMKNLTNFIIFKNIILFLFFLPNSSIMLMDFFFSFVICIYYETFLEDWF